VVTEEVGESRRLRDDVFPHGDGRDANSMDEALLTLKSHD